MAWLLPIQFIEIFKPSNGSAPVPVSINSFKPGRRF